jgi:DNA gyrase subunit A
MITEKGMVVRTSVGDTRTIGRNTQGVTLMSVEEGDRIVSVGLIEPEEDAADSAASPADAKDVVLPVDTAPKTGEIPPPETPPGS